MSFLELYNDTVTNLLKSETRVRDRLFSNDNVEQLIPVATVNLRQMKSQTTFPSAKYVIKENSLQGVYITNLTEKNCESA